MAAPPPPPNPAPANPAPAARSMWTEEQRLRMAEIYRDKCKIIDGAFSYKPGQVLTRQDKTNAWQEIVDAVSSIGPAWNAAQCKQKMSTEKSFVRTKEKVHVQ